jgi:hypothetical protein
MNANIHDLEVMLMQTINATPTLMRMPIPMTMLML